MLFSPPKKRESQLENHWKRRKFKTSFIKIRGLLYKIETKLAWFGAVCGKEEKTPSVLDVSERSSLDVDDFMPMGKIFSIIFDSAVNTNM